MESIIPIKYKSFLNRSMWLIDWTLTNITTPDQSGPRIESNERVLHTPQISRIEASPTDTI